ncbi:MAG: tryptophan-rich sensory protein [Caldilineaceae bacterium]|nr:tryptophan-rich sensory protein [Caldilineaceae bacterium]
MKSIPIKSRKNTQLVSIGIAALAPTLAAVIGGAATGKTLDDWYLSLDKPKWNPPNWLFPVAWTFLFTMMGIASWLVWREGRSGNEKDLSTSSEAKTALKIYGIHLVFNTLWSIIFFGMRKLGWAFVELLVLWHLVVATIASFYRIKPVAGLMLIPYLLWTTFAGILNFMVWRMNRK